MNARIPIERLTDHLAQQLPGIVGTDGVTSDPAGVEHATRTCVPVRTVPSAVVYPCTAAEVQAVVRAAAASDVPIWPVSTGKNWGYGERAAAYDRGIAVTLERMNQIVHVNEQLGYAGTKPGVAYKPLNDDLNQAGPRLWADCASTTQYASVITIALAQQLVPRPKAAVDPQNLVVPGSYGRPLRPADRA